MATTVDSAASGILERSGERTPDLGRQIHARIPEQRTVLWKAEPRRAAR